MNYSRKPLRISRCIGMLFAVLLIKSVSSHAAEPTAKAQPAANAKTVLQPFLNNYCVRCHGEKKQEAERRFHQLPAEIVDDNTLVDFQDILDQLNLGQMPPAEEKQPTETERQATVEWLTNTIRQYHETRKHTSDRPVLRRLNSREYRRTVRDLLHLNMTMFDPTSTFPRDQTEEHLDNLGESLVTSGYLLARYLEAAEQVVDKALLPVQKPSVQTWAFRDNFRQQPEIDQVHRNSSKFQYMTLYDVVAADKPEGAYGPILAFKQGVPTDGYYEIRLKAEALNRLHPYDEKLIGTDRSQPFRLGIVAGNQRAGFLHKPQPVEPLLAEIKLADEQKWYTVKVWLDAGYTPRFTFRNGLMDVRNLWTKLYRTYPKLFKRPGAKSGIVETRRSVITNGHVPQIRIHEIEIRGPIINEWPTAGQRELLGDNAGDILKTGTFSREQMQQQLTTLASRAYRRPATTTEVERLLQLIDKRRAAGQTALAAYSDGVKMLLCSPHFLYLNPAADEKSAAYALATRLSYFLWSSMPDRELLELAATGELLQTQTLSAQVERMLADEKSNAFVEGFLDSWLTLRDLGSMPPDRTQFSDFYRHDLQAAMLRETRLFTRHLLDENLSIQNFLHAEFTFVNRPLARHYDLQPPAEPGFTKVTLDNRRRGGLLGQASVLTVTANGIDTSPVVRGVWVLENILGTPPSPPPPDVEPLDPDVRGAKTIRDRLQKHRKIAACNSCHRKIDPAGFALENFDPVGRWRSSYAGKKLVDASGELPNGRKFTDIRDFKELLSEQQPQFAKALTEKLLAYATGRLPGPTDRPEIDRIVRDLKPQNDGLRDLVKLVVRSQTFRDSPTR